MSMKDPPFEITRAVLTDAAEISELVGRLSTGKLSTSPMLRRTNRIRSIQGSLAIEQNALSVEQMTDILNGRRVMAPPRDIAEARNAYAAYEGMDRWNPYSVDSLLEAHGIMMRGLLDEAGCFRSSSVGVADSRGNILHIGTLPRYVPESVERLLNWTRDSTLPMLIKSCVFHYEFELIHPFADGNGRMGRLWHTFLLTTWNPLMAWLPVESVIHNRQSEYYEAINASNISGQSTAFLEFMLSAIKTALREASGDGKPYGALTSRSEELASRRPKGLASRRRFVLDYLAENSYITNADVREGLGVSSATANRILTTLWHDGTLRRVRRGKLWAYEAGEPNPSCPGKERSGAK